MGGGAIVTMALASRARRAAALAGRVKCAFQSRGGTGSGFGWLERMEEKGTTMRGEGKDWNRTSRGFSASAPDAATEEQKKGKEEKEKASEEPEGGGEGPESAEEIAPDVNQLQEQLEKQKVEVADLRAKAKESDSRLLRVLADMENLRERTARQAENATKFGIQGFAKGIVGVIDTFERAVDSVPTELMEEVESGTEEEKRLRQVLRSFHEGIKMTEKQLLQVLKENGVEQYDPTGEPFDPNLHQALFELEDPSKEAGTVAMVTKKGYLLHERVMRPADVGVVKAKSE